MPIAFPRKGAISKSNPHRRFARKAARREAAGRMGDLLNLQGPGFCALEGMGSGQAQVPVAAEAGLYVTLTSGVTVTELAAVITTR